MGILGRILSLPVRGPLEGVLWVAQKIEQEAKAGQWDQGKIIAALSELELELDLGKIDLDEYDMREASLLHLLKELQEAENGQ
jgi:hypothetical protein